ncbi:MAG: N-acetylmuramoyl-L-alanine amidase [Longicatena sp.]
MLSKKKSLVLLCILVLYFIPFMYKQTSSLLSTNATKVNIQAKNMNTTNSNVIVLDAGHGGYDCGSISSDGVYEKDITLAITLKIGDILEKAGYHIVYTRVSDEVSWSDDNFIDLASRVEIAQAANADYYISIHTNASEYNDGVKGFESYIDYSNQTIQAMAKQIETNMSSLNYTENRGIKSSAERPLYVIDENEVPALLLELGFISDNEDASYLTSTQNQLLIASAIADGIITTMQA